MFTPPEAIHRTTKTLANLVFNGLRKVFYSLTLCFICSAPAFAADLVLEPGLQPNRPYIDQAGFEQIDTYTRALRLSFVDVHLPGNGGFDLKLYRTYDSRGKDDTLKRPFSHGWNMHMGYITMGATGINPCDWSGMMNNYRTTLHTPQGETAQLMATYIPNAPSMFSNRWKLDCTRTSSAKIVIIDTEGSSYEFSLIDTALYMTTRITDRHGNWAAISYVPTIGYSQAIQPNVSGITTSDGRSVNFNYVRNYGLQSITAANQTYTYEYCTFVEGAAAKLIGVTRPDSTRWRFAYHG